MIQFNLLPDVKIEYIRARRMKRAVMLVSTLVASVSLVVLLALFLGVSVFQKRHLSNLGADIDKTNNQIKQIKDLDKILTVQNQLNNLASLHEQKPVATRVFTFVEQTTPKEVNIASYDIDFTTQTIIVKGSALSLAAVNKFADTFKFTQFKVQGSDDSSKAFSDVVVSQFGRDDKSATYELTMKYAPEIFDGKNAVQLTVPANFITTRSETEKPTNPLFKQTSNGQGQ